MRVWLQKLDFLTFIVPRYAVNVLADTPATVQVSTSKSDVNFRVEVCFLCCFYQTLMKHCWTSKRWNSIFYNPLKRCCSDKRDPKQRINSYRYSMEKTSYSNKKESDTSSCPASHSTRTRTAPPKEGERPKKHVRSHLRRVLRVPPCHPRPPPPSPPPYWPVQTQLLRTF